MTQKYLFLSAALALSLFSSACGGIISGSSIDVPSIPGPAGPKGDQGVAGHSIVYSGRLATGVECPVNGGQAADFYLDLDDTLSKTAGDTLMGGIISCNGADGSNGTNGTNGTNGSNGTGVLASAATAAQCLSGGTVLQTFSDTNGDGSLSVGESILSSNVVCNGTNGTNGTNGINATAAVSAYSFSNAAACQEVVSGALSANKLSANNDSIRIFSNSTCSGQPVETLSSTGNEAYFYSNSTLLIIHGDNASGLYLRKVIFQ